MDGNPAHRLGVTHNPFVKMHLAAGSVFLLLASLMTTCTSGRSRTSGTASLEGNGSAADAGFVPLTAAKVNQIIAREGSCVLIDCNVSGDPFPSFQWFNSHGDRLDTEAEGEAAHLNLFFCSLVHQQNVISRKNQIRRHK